MAMAMWGEMTTASVPLYPVENDTDVGDYGEFRPLSPTEITIIACTVATLAVIFVLGTVGNFLVCLVIATYHQMRTVFNILVFNLAVTDLLLGVLVAPTYAARLAYELLVVKTGAPSQTNSSGIFVVCHISAFTHYVCTAQSLMTMTQMGIIRAIAVLKSTKNIRFRIRKIVPCALILINYIISLTFSAFTYKSGTYSFCLDRRMRLKLRERLVGLGIIIGELTVISITYTWIYYGTKRQKAGIEARLRQTVEAAAGAARVARPTNRFDIATAKSLLMVVSAFIVSYMPYVVFISLWAVGVVEDEPRLMVIFPALTSLCSVVNPFIYAANSSVFRRQLLKLLRLDKKVLRQTVPAIAVRMENQQDSLRQQRITASDLV
ncbi:neuromedin-U receptor 2-like [Patiria miniata]|uniref:G-protein coupled receptors family 1 profile domain-containing protein n=1 Tax=Patiria miniata TaxID=46514 RepID=A0A914AIM6_PATMI|nr:neuromedin-U receptor 2-like [Patiria miniata]